MAQAARHAVLILIALRGAAAADITADEYEGTFEGAIHHAEPRAGSVDDRVLTKGHMKVVRVGANQWRGTASAHLKITLTTNASGVHMTNTGDGDVTGAVELDGAISAPGYQLRWKLAPIATTMKVDVPGAPAQVVAMKLTFDSTTTISRNAAEPADG